MCTWSAQDFTWARSSKPLAQPSGEFSLDNLMHVVKKQRICFSLSNYGIRLLNVAFSEACLLGKEQGPA